MFKLVLLSCVIAVSQAQYPGAYPGAPQSFAQPAPTGQDGTVVDTPEVAQAKAAHFAEFARAAARAAEDRGQEDGAYNPNAYSAPAPQQQFAYQGHHAQPAPPQFARANYGPAPAPLQYQQSAPQGAYHQQFGPEPKAFNIPAGAKAPFQPAPLAEDGTVVDTPEVAALKAARLQELADAEARAAKYAGPQEQYSGDYHGQYQAAPQPNQYQAPQGGIPRAYPGAPAPSYPGAPQAFSPSARAYQPQAPVYQPQPQQYQQPQSYQSQY